MLTLLIGMVSLGMEMIAARIDQENQQRQWTQPTQRELLAFSVLRLITRSQAGVLTILIKQAHKRRGKRRHAF